MLQKVAVPDAVDLSAVFQAVHNSISEKGFKCSIKGVCDEVHILKGMASLTYADGARELGVKQRGGIVATFAKMQSDGHVVPMGTLKMDAVHDCLKVCRQELGL